jgi:hypothetical protein
MKQHFATGYVGFLVGTRYVHEHPFSLVEQSCLIAGDRGQQLTRRLFVSTKFRRVAAA